MVPSEAMASKNPAGRRPEADDGGGAGVVLELEVPTATDDGGGAGVITEPEVPRLIA